MIQMSQQNLIDCSYSQGDYGIFDAHFADDNNANDAIYSKVST